MRIATTTWVGYAGLWLAKDLGYFDEAGLDVHYSIIDDVGQIQNALASNNIEGMATTIDGLPRYASKNIPIKTVFALDHSNGADGLITTNDIKSVSDLKGKEIAVENASVSEWFLANVLKKNGLSLNDVKLKNMSASDAGSAFVAKKIGAAVTWEPWLSNAKKTGFGTVLVDSSKYPDAIVDVFGFNKTFIAQHPDTVKTFVQMYDKGVTYLKQHPTEAYTMLAKHYNESAEEVKGQLEGLQIMSVSDSKTFFGSSSNPGLGYQLAEEASNVWFEQGILNQKVDKTQINELIDPSYLSQ